MVEAAVYPRRDDEAIAWFENSRRANPSSPICSRLLASAYALKGQNERAAAELAETWRLSPDGRYSSIAGLKAAEYFGSREVQALVEATYFAGLRKAGIPWGWFLERAIRLSPRDGFLGHWYNWFGRIYLLRGRVEPVSRIKSRGGRGSGGSQYPKA